MLKAIILILIFSTNLAWGTTEPSIIILVSNGKVTKVNLMKLKKTELETLNYHPKFKDQGKLKYSGYLVKDILKHIKLLPEQAITILGKTGQFSVEVLAKEFLSGRNLIATHLNNEPIASEEKGLQIIYDGKTISKFPHLKERQYWCWWVRTLITDQKYKPSLKIQKKIEQSFKTELPWPVPYGISSLGSEVSINQRAGLLLNAFKTMKIELLNGNEQEIIADQKTKYFLANPISNKSGAYSLHQIIENNGKIEAFVSNLYYLKSVEVNQ